MWHKVGITLPINSKSSLLASPRAAGAATATRTSSAFTPSMDVKKRQEAKNKLGIISNNSSILAKITLKAKTVASGVNIQEN